MGKIYSIQFLRAMAAIFVVISHVWATNGVIGKPLGFDFIGGYGVDIFFVISGFIMCYTIKDVFVSPRKEALSFITKRILRIYPVYFIIASPAIIYLMHQHVAFGGTLSVYDVIGNFLLLPTFTQNPDYHMFYYVAWSLCYEMMFYALFALLMCFCKRKTTLVLSMIAIMVSMVVFVQTFRLQGQMLGWVNITYMIGDSLMINFALGCVAFLIYSQIRNVSINPLIAIGMIALLIAIGIINAQHQAYRLFSFGITSFAIVMIALYTKLPDIEKSKTETICVYLGNASYSIYLFHLYVVFASEKIYSIVPLQKDVTGAIMSFVAVLMGCIFYTFIEKPLNSIIHGRVYRRLHA